MYDVGTRTLAALRLRPSEGAGEEEGGGGCTVHMEIASSHGGLRFA